MFFDTSIHSNKKTKSVAYLNLDSCNVRLGLYDPIYIYICIYFL